MFVFHAHAFNIALLLAVDPPIAQEAQTKPGAQWEAHLEKCETHEVLIVTRFQQTSIPTLAISGEHRTKRLSSSLREPR